MYNFNKIRENFPIFHEKIYKNKPLVYLDSNATSLKPKSVIAKEFDYYSKYSANVFRGIYKISERATEEYELSREIVAKFIGASKDEIVFTRNTSESLNLIFYIFSNYYKNQNKIEVVTTIMEHHSNFVPWQQGKEKGMFNLKIWECDNNCNFNLNDLDNIITRNTKLFTFTHVSNVSGTINPVKEIVKKVKSINPDCLILLDAAQSVPHQKIDVKALGVDMIAFSSHKMLGPTGVGVLWAKKEILEKFPPFMYGGDMISEVHKNKTIFNKHPHKFEAGTPNIAGVIGLGEAVNFLNSIGMDNIKKYEDELSSYAYSRLSKLSFINIIGPKEIEKRSSVVSFHMKNVHPHDVAQILDEDNICIRVGYHCAQPLHEHLSIGPTCRASFYIYNNIKDIDILSDSLEKVYKVFL